MNQDEINLRWIFTVVLRWWWVITGCTILVGGAAFMAMSSLTPTYEATAVLLVSPIQNSRTDEYSTLVAAERLALTYIEILKGETVLEKVISQLGLQQSRQSLANQIDAEPVRGTQLIRLTARSTSPTEAALLANTIAEVVTAHIQRLQSDRYTQSLDNLQEEMKGMIASSQETQAQIDALNAKKVKGEAGLANLEMLLNEQRSDYRALERDYQDLKLSIAQVTDVVKIVELAQAASKTAFVPIKIPSRQDKDGPGHEVNTTATFPQVTTILLIGHAPSPGAAEADQQLIQTYSKMLVGRPVLEAAIAKLGLNETPESLGPRVSASRVQDTQLIDLDVVDSNTEKGALIANTIAEIFVGNIKALLDQPYLERLSKMQEQLDELSAQIDETLAKILELTTSNGQIEMELVRLQTLLADQRSEYQVTQADYRQLTLLVVEASQVVSITESAQVPGRSANSNNLIYVLIATAAAAIFATGIVLVLEFFNETLRTSEDIIQSLGLAPLGTIGQLAKRDEGLVIISRPLSQEAEAFRRLVANLRYSGMEHPLRTLLITSPNMREGKSTVAANLAAALALTERSVLLIDADLRKPQLHQIFGIEQSDGLTEALLERAIDGKLKQVEPAKVKVLTSGTPPPNPAEIVGSTRMCELLEQLKQQADIVLIDCPPVLPVVDAALLAPQVDGVLIVLRANRTRRRTAIEAVEAMQKVGAQIVGVVMNATPGKRIGYHPYYAQPGRNRSGSSIQSLKNVLLSIQHKIGKKA